MSVVLASGSAARAALLHAAGVDFEVVRPGVDEDAAKLALLADGAAPRQIADALAELKAVRVSQAHPGALVIGADQTLELDGRLLSKPVDRAAARDQLLSLKGCDHRLHSAVVVARGGAPVWRELATARMQVRAFSDAFLEDYLEREDAAVLESVGGYRIEGLGAQLFARVEGDTPTVMGLPLIGLLDLLRRHGELLA